MPHPEWTADLAHAQGLLVCQLRTQGQAGGQTGMGMLGAQGEEGRWAALKVEPACSCLGAEGLVPSGQATTLGHICPSTGLTMVLIEARPTN